MIGDKHPKKLVRFAYKTLTFRDVDPKIVPVLGIKPNPDTRLGDRTEAWSIILPVDVLLTMATATALSARSTRNQAQKPRIFDLRRETPKPR